MLDKYIQNHIFDNIDFTETTLERGEYEECTFKNCNFGELNLSGFIFDTCTFVGCNLSLAKLFGTALRGIRFDSCKMLGLHFDDCNQFGLSFMFKECQLNHSSFYQTKIKRTAFKNCQLVEVDFAESDLAGSVFDNCEMSGTTFDRTNIEKADFRTSHNYIINPENNKMKGAKFSLSGVVGLLSKYGIEIV